MCDTLASINLLLILPDLVLLFLSLFLVAGAIKMKGEYYQAPEEY
jgi:hypothetical protein